MKKTWFTFAVGLALMAGQTFAQDAPATAAPATEPTPAAPARGLKPIPDVMESTALGFRRVNAARSFENAEKTTVRLVRNGRVVQAKRVGVGGVAQMSEVSPGAYSVFATGSEGFAAYGIYLGDGSASLTSSVGLIPRSDMGPVMEAIRTYTRSSSGSTPTPAGAARVAKDLDRITENGDFELLADGSVKGQIVRPAPRADLKTPIENMHVDFVREGRIVGSATSNADGEFTVTGLEPGIYSLVVAGNEGFAAFAVGAVRPAQQAQARIRRFEFVAAAVQTTVVTICPVPPSDFGLLNVLANGTNNVTNRPVTPVPMSGGGFPGAGAAGGAGGGGGFGGLLGAAAAAGAGAAIGYNANNGPSTP